ncbi:hypothetical protein [Persephonella sp.]
MENTEKTLKKMAILIEKISQKIDELDERVQKLEMKSLSQKPETDHSPHKNLTDQSSTQTLKSGFLGSLLGTFAGMSLFNILMDDKVSPEDVARETGISEADLTNMEEKLEEISEKIDEIEEKIETEELAMEDELPDVEPNMEYFETDFGLDDEEWIA